MSAKMYLLAGAAGLAALVGVASPAAAQYPGYGYGYGNTNSVGGILGQILGYGQYPYGNYGYNQYNNQSSAIDQCARAVEARLNGYNGYYGYGNQGYGGYGGYNNGYGGYGNQYGYNQGYGAGGHVQGITRVERKSYGLKVSGVASSGYRGYQGYGRSGYGSYGYGNGADLSFECKVENNGRIRDIDLNRRSAYWRGY